MKAPSRTAVVPPPGMPSARVGMKLALAAALLAASGAATPSMAPCAHLVAVLGHLLLDAVGHERREGRAGAGQHPER